MSATVSLILCVYNGAEFLPRCLDSVAAQDYEGTIDLIIVDDGSTDSSGRIADDFAATHLNTRVIHQENAGLGASRNRAIKIARGAYVAFLDADDLLPPDAIRLRVEAMQSTGADLAVCRIEIIPGDRKWGPAKDFTEDVVINGLAERPSLLATTSSLNKLFHKSFFDDPSNLFVEGVHFEDLPNMTAALVTAKRIAILSKAGYQYRRVKGSGSIMDTAFVKPANYFDHLLVNEMVFKRFTAPEQRALVEGFLINKIAPYLEHAARALTPSDFSRFFQRTREVYGEISLERIAKATGSITRRLAFIGLLANEPDLLYCLDSAIVGVSSDGTSFVLDRPVDERFAPLLRRPASAKRTSPAPR